MPRLLVLILIALLAFALACGDDDDGGGPGARPDITPGGGEFDEGGCPFEEPEDEDVECGTLTVPADRDDPDSGEIELAVAVFRARDDDPAPDPIVYLDGGPGGNTLEALPLTFSFLVDPFLDERDFIVFDQRGVGYSEPAMVCEDALALDLEALEEGLSEDEYLDELLAEISDCREELVDDGVDPDFANSAESAADVEDLRLALGYDEWNLFGISYGTRLALTVLRDYPDGVRSVVLDSVFPLEEDLASSVPGSFARALDVLYEDCAADDGCAEDYPDLEAALLDTVEELNENPEEVELGFGLGGFVALDQVVLTGDVLLQLLHQTFYATELIPFIPELIYEAHDGDYDLAGFLISSFIEQQQEYFSLGMYLSVQCSEDVPFVSREDAQAAVEEYPDIRGAFQGDPDRTYEACEAWDAKPAPAFENEPVESDVPALVLAGSYDPITPPAWGEQVTDQLDDAYFFEFPASGHAVVLSSACAERLMRRFLDDPGSAPDADCIDRLDPPEFGGIPFF